MKKKIKREKIPSNELITKQVNGITLIALVVTMVFFYDKLKKCSNSNSFLLLGI